MWDPNPMNRLKRYIRERKPAAARDVAREIVYQALKSRPDLRKDLKRLDSEAH